MFTYSFFIIFSLHNLINTNAILRALKSSNGIISDDDSFYIFRSIVYHLIGVDDSFVNGLNLSTKCMDQLSKSFFQNGMSMSFNAFPYYRKLYFHSSKNKNDLSTYYDCINNEVEGYVDYDFVKENFTFFTVLIDDKKSLYDIMTSNNGSSAYLLGLCFIDDCNIDDYKILMKKGLAYFNLTLNEDTTMKIFRMDDNIKSKGFIKFLELIPFIIICVPSFLNCCVFCPLYKPLFVQENRPREVRLPSRSSNI